MTTHSHGLDYYAALEVEPTATDADIKRAFRRLARVWHPDKSVTGNTERMQLLIEAKHVLLDPAKRAAHDRARAARKRKSAAASRLHRSAPRHTSGDSASRTAATVLGSLLVFGAAAAALSVFGNDYDRSVGRYRGRDGTFRNGRFG